MSGLSKELQLGKAAEHLVCAELILLGFSAFLADAGLPYDVLVDTGTDVLRVQVKSTRALYQAAAKTPTYRFGLRKGRHYGRISADAVDVFAFVALDVRRVAYLNTEQLLRPDGRVQGLIEFVDESEARRWGARTFQKCSAFPPGQARDGFKACFGCGAEKPATLKHFEPHKRCRGGLLGVCRDCRRPANTKATRAQRAA